MRENLDHFPHVQHAFAYGSGVFKQPGLYSSNVAKADGPMIDMILAVDDPIAWHREVTHFQGGEISLWNFSQIPALLTAQNIAKHGSHYSGLKWFGASTVRLQFFLFFPNTATNNHKIPVQIDRVAERIGAGVYFNTLIPWGSGVRFQFIFNYLERPTWNSKFN